MNLSSKRSFKAVAIGCAVLLTCATAQIFASTSVLSNSTAIYAETLAYTTEFNENGTLIIHLTNTLNSDSTVDLTLTGGQSGYVTTGEVGYWDNTAQEWVSGYYKWKDETFDSNGKLTISGIKVPGGISDVQILVTYYAILDESIKDMAVGSLEDDNVKVSSLVTSGSSSSTTTTTTSAAVTTAPATTTAPTTTTTSSTTTSSSTSTGSVTIDKTEIEENEDGTDVLKLHFDTGSSSTVTLTLTGGTAGATTSGQVGYWDSSKSKWVINDDWEEQKFDSNGNLTITGLKVPTDTKDVQILLTYYADWSSGSGVLLDKSSLSASISTSGSSSSNSSSNTSDSSNSSSMPSTASCGWEDITQGTDNTQTTNLISSSTSGETKTVTITQGGQWSSYDEGNEPIILDQTWKPEVTGQYDTDRGNEKITNSNNFMFTDDLNIPTNAEIDHFRFTFETDKSNPMYKVQFGAGISVQKDSEIANSGSVDEDGNITSKVWFNESGSYDPNNDKDYSDITNSNGKSYYGFNTLDTYSGGTNYIQAQWNVYDDVKPYIQNDAWSSVSVQYWYGIDPATVEDYEKDLTPEQVTITEATVNYSITESYKYTDTATQKVSLSPSGEMAGVKFSDLGLEEGDKPQAVTIKVKSSSGDIGKLVGAFGVSVNDNYSGDDLTDDNWYQSSSLVYEDCSDTYEITWVIPSQLTNYISPEYDGEIKFGAWYTDCDSITIEEISVDYYSEPEVTTTTTEATTTTVTTTEATTTTSATTTTPVTTTTAVPTTTTTITTTTTTTATDSDIIWGDVNVDGVVDGRDLLLFKKNALGLADISEQGNINADVTHDDAVDGRDLLKLKKFMLGLIEESALATK